MYAIPTIEFSETSDIYASPEVFDAFIQRIQSERAPRRQARRLSAYRRRAVEELTSEIELSLEAEDEEVCAELERLLCGFRSLIDIATDPVATNVSIFPIPTVIDDNAEAEIDFSGAVPQAHNQGETRTQLCSGESRTEVLTAAPQAQTPNETQTPLCSSKCLDEVSKAAPQALIPAVHLSREERKQKAADLLTVALFTEERLAVLKHQIDGGAKGPQLLELRAAGSMVERIYSECRACGVNGTVGQTVAELRETVDAIRDRCDDYRPPAIPFEARYRSGSEGKPTFVTADWSDLENQFSFAARAYDGLDWFAANWTDIDLDERRSLLNSIGAVSQLLKRTLDQYNSKDGVQHEMYAVIKSTATKADCYLAALAPETTTDELQISALQYELCLQDAKTNCKANNEARLKTQLKEEARAQFESLIANCPDLGIVEGRLSEDRRRLFGILDKLLATGIPYSDKRIREALLYTGPALLADERRFEKMLAGICIERSRRGIGISETPPDDLIPEEDIAPVVTIVLDSVREWAAGLKLLILGGTPRQKTREELQELIGCAEVVWPASKPSDKAQKFRTAINKADVVMVLKNFASHEISDKGREWAKGNGSHFLMLPSGYGVNQIVQQLYEHIERANR